MGVTHIKLIHLNLLLGLSCGELKFLVKTKAGGQRGRYDEQWAWEYQWRPGWWVVGEIQYRTQPSPSDRIMGQLLPLLSAWEFNYVEQIETQWNILLCLKYLSPQLLINLMVMSQ